ncbi:sensor histidine kinase [Phytohabitans rumicis]|uniref:sensor histidine kinase n=1 Tax=Phytohabitans rumicis TaxID=1076125 RepID=UPI0031E62094
MTIRTLLGPLASGRTYRRGVHLLLGAVILLPYVLLGVTFARMLTGPREYRGAALLLLAVTGAIAAVPAFMRGTRSLEIAAARALLGVDLPDPPAAPPARETRVRGALWFGVHLVAGGAVAAGLLVAVPMAFIFVAELFGVATEATEGLRIGQPWLSLLGVLLLVGMAYAVAGLGALAALMAPVLLGPSPAEEIAALAARAERLAERNRLARELHDSVGHALTVTTLQAAAAREVLDSDPEFARRALAAIEDAGRGAMADLDYVLGVLRDREDERRAPQPTLADLDRLVADARSAGVAVRLERGPLDAVPAAVSREGYRIVQEGLTNAARHAGRVPVTLRVAAANGTLDIDVANPLLAPKGQPYTRLGGHTAALLGTGRGLAGMRERVTLLGGRMTAGPEGGSWRVVVRLPI